nr:piRNA biogenesis protein EXD1-like [Ipomoea batatas]
MLLPHFQDPKFWKYRPLSDLMVRAAADEVRFLLSIYHRMSAVHYIVDVSASLIMTMQIGLLFRCPRYSVAPRYSCTDRHPLLFPFKQKQEGSSWLRIETCNHKVISSNPNLLGLSRHL